MDFLINSAQAQTMGAPGGQSILSALMLPVLLLVVFYFLLIRPQNKRAKEQREMLSKVAAGDWPVKGRTSYPLLFDRNGMPKPAVDAVLKVPSEAAKH